MSIIEPKRLVLRPFREGHLVRKYISFALVAVCAFSLSACADTESSDGSSYWTAAENTAEETGSEKDFYYIVEENGEKYGALKDGLSTGVGLSEWSKAAGELSQSEFLELYNAADGSLKLLDFPPEKCCAFYGYGVSWWCFNIEYGFTLRFGYNDKWTLSCGNIEFDPGKETPEEFFERMSVSSYYADADRQLTKEEYFDIVYENAEVNGFYCDGFDDDFYNADEITMDYFLASWKSDEGVPLINRFAPELCYMICGSGMTYYRFKIEGDFVLTFGPNGIFHSISCMRGDKVIEFDPKETVYDFFEKYAKNA